MKRTDFRELFQKLRHLLRRWRFLFLALLMVALIIFPYATDDNYIRGIAIKMLMYVLLASAINVVNGYSGQLFIGQAGFMCLGAYTAAKLMTVLHVNFFLAMLLAGLATALFGYLISFPTRRLTGMYLTIVSLGFSEIIRIIALNWTSFTGGPMGIKAIPAPSFFGIVMRSSYCFYYIILALCVLLIFCTYRLLNSRIGRAWMSIRENSQAASSLGISVFNYKALNLAYAAFWSGVGGAFMASYYQYIDSSMFLMEEGFNILSMTIVGGMGTLVGPVVGAVLINYISEAFRVLRDYRLVMYAIIIIVMMWFRPQGLFGASDSALAFHSRKKAGTQAKREGA